MLKRHLLQLLTKEAMRRMAKLDLDARRAEADRTPHEVTLGGQSYLFKATMPVEFMDLLKEGRMNEGMQMLMLDASEWDQLRKAVPDNDDLMAIVELYGLDQGESSASAASSNGDGTKPRPTSSGTTRSTSPKPAGGRKR